VVGIGGIACSRDALEFLIAGATAVQVGTANFVDPLAAVKVISGLEDFCREQHIPRIRDLIGSLQPVPAGDFVYY
jgi:dihydroorotate dehydrogenase (NAD+) catalytic subunit